MLIVRVQTETFLGPVLCGSLVMVVHADPGETREVGRIGLVVTILNQLANFANHETSLVFPQLDLSPGKETIET